MKNLFSICLAVFLTGCATYYLPSIQIKLPNGDNGFSIFCGRDVASLRKAPYRYTSESSWGVCYYEAGNVCPFGYSIIERRARELPENSRFYEPRFMVIKCKKR